MTRSARRRPNEAGFSFVEILIVMGIIAVLSGLVVVAIQIVGRKKPQFETQTRVQKLMQMAEGLKGKWGGMYPPATLAAIEAVAGGGGSIKKIPNHSNEGIEALYQSMYWPGTGLDPQIKDEELCNTDEDEMEKAIGRGKTLDEVKDGYGNPIVYIPNTDYVSAFDKPLTYIDKNGQAVEVRPWKTERGFENPSSCQVFSFGEDELPNTEDDIKGW